ncbi:MAG: type II toxin-antitoxin system VapC family toxin [Geminicoccaceae bacterium]
MPFLVDTNVVSELRRPKPHGAVLAWIGGVTDADLFLAAVTLGEIQAGIEITREQDSARAEALESWLEQVAASWNILPADAAVFRCWAKLMHRQPADLIEDGLIAATALVHGLTVVTRNVRDFARFGVDTLDPFRIRA